MGACSARLLRKVKFALLKKLRRGLLRQHMHSYIYDRGVDWLGKWALFADLFRVFAASQFKFRPSRCVSCLLHKDDIVANDFVVLV